MTSLYVPVTAKFSSPQYSRDMRAGLAIASRHSFNCAQQRQNILADR
ncbi:MAG: hypothetical protein ACFB12_20095 [Leptolyngbyaceae cyanobacterium]